MTLDVIIVGAGPTGLACALEARRHGLTCAAFDRGCITNSIYRFPAQMVFFTTPELLEIGNMPLVCEREKPTRHEALKYYRKIVGAQGLNVHQYEEVLNIRRDAGLFRVETSAGHYHCGNVVLATGYYDNPNRLGVPGEELPHVSHYYTEAHPFFDRDVVVIGGRNSAAEAALDLFRGGARVAVVHRGTEFGETVKYWIRPDIENRIQRSEIRAYFGARVTEIKPGAVGIAQNSKVLNLRADQVFAMTGYHPSTQFLDQLGVKYDPATLRPQYDPETFLTSIAGVYLAGSVVAGHQKQRDFHRERTPARQDPDGYDSKKSRPRDTGGMMTSPQHTTSEKCGLVACTIDIDTIVRSATVPDSRSDEGDHAHSL